MRAHRAGAQGRGAGSGIQAQASGGTHRALQTSKQRAGTLTSWEFRNNQNMQRFHQREGQRCRVHHAPPPQPHWLRSGQGMPWAAGALGSPPESSFAVETAWARRRPLCAFPRRQLGACLPGGASVHASRGPLRVPGRGNAAPLDADHSTTVNGCSCCVPDCADCNPHHSAVESGAQVWWDTCPKPHFTKSCREHLNGDPEPTPGPLHYTLLCVHRNAGSHVRVCTCVCVWGGGRGEKGRDFSEIYF